ncbi:MAG TPA: PhoH family protein [Phycisphaerae bacterium]|nr:PhoH family protein [Phycisphaerae bacterium]
MRKNYILDANILLHDPQSIFSFEDNTVIIPVGVISEIDQFKKERTDRGYNARAVVRLLDSLRHERSLAQGVSLTGGGTLRVHCEPERVLTGSNGHADLEILRVARAIQEQDRETPVVIVTKDINLRIRADAAGLRAEDYESDQVQLADLDPGYTELRVPGDAFLHFQDHGELPLEKPIEPNEYVLLRPAEDSHGSALARVDAEGKRLVALKVAEDGLWGVKPRNKEQYFAIDALLDPAIQLVTLMGKAGTGKTLLAIAAAMHLTLRRKKYRGVLVCRPIFPVGRDLGYLPGDIGQKLDPWMRPVSDTVEFLLDLGGPVKGHGDCAELVRSGLIEIQPLTYIRGRSIANRFVVIDEAQNLTPLEIKTVITRMGQAAKVVLTGDPQQIDNPYVDANSNGFTYLVNRFRAQPISAHIDLRKGERSILAELAANLL